MTETHFTIDKRVPVAVILTMSINIAALIWFASSLNSRVQSLENRAENFSVQTDRLGTDVRAQSERLVRVETKVDTIQTNIAELKTLLRGLPSP